MKVKCEDVARWLVKHNFDCAVPESGNYSDVSGQSFYIAPLFLDGQTKYIIFATDKSDCFGSLDELEREYSMRFGLGIPFSRKWRDWRFERIMRKVLRRRKKERLEKETSNNEIDER
jgi:hypothetical protein